MPVTGRCPDWCDLRDGETRSTVFASRSVTSTPGVATVDTTACLLDREATREGLDAVGDGLPLRNQENGVQNVARCARSK